MEYQQRMTTQLLESGHLHQDGFHSSNIVKINHGEDYREAEDWPLVKQDI